MAEDKKPKDDKSKVGDPVTMNGKKIGEVTRVVQKKYATYVTVKSTVEGKDVTP